MIKLDLLPEEEDTTEDSTEFIEVFNIVDSSVDTTGISWILEVEV